jgi:hypothetical protein
MASDCLVSGFECKGDFSPTECDISSTVPSETGENRAKRSFDLMSQEWIALVALCSVPIFILISHFISEARGMATCVSTGMIALVVYYFWDLRKRIWFWATMAFIAVLHVLFVLFLPPPDKHWNYLSWNRVQMLPVAFLDFGFAYGIIRLVENLMKKFEKPADNGDSIFPKTAN